MARLRADGGFRRDVTLAARYGVPLSSFLGESKSATADTFDADGNLISRTVTTTPSPWTDADRDAVAALYADELDTCPSCGFPRTLCRDPNIVLYPQREVCGVEKARVWASRKRGEVVERLEKSQPLPDGWRHDDGEVIRMSLTDDTPDDNFLT